MLNLAISREFRAHLTAQGKAQSDGNDWSFSRAATPTWVVRCAPNGRAGMGPPALFRLSARTRPLPSSRASRAATFHLAESARYGKVEH